ncbi:MAG: recombinase RecA [Candidatus Goldiibacteriota bacterium]
MAGENGSEKKKALSLAIEQIEKEYGKGSIMKLGAANIGKIEGIPTGALSLDLALGGSGIPKGRIVEIFGPESSGKSTLALNIVAQCQKNGGTAAYVDAENAMDSVYAGAVGVNIDELLISQPDTGEQGLEIVEKLVRSNAVDIIVVDSVAALVPKSEIEGDMGDSQMGVQARLMSQAMRKLTTITNKSHCVVVFINQIREKIGVMFGNPETTPGGRALKFYSSVRIDIRRIETIKKGDVMTGNRVRAKVVKNKVAPPFKEAIFEIIFGKGIMRQNATLEAAVASGIIDRSGTWYSYKGEKIGQGKDASVNYLLEHDEICEEIETRTKDKHFGRGEFSPEEKEKAEKKAAEKEAAEEKAKKAAELAAAKAKIIKAKS